MKGNDIFSGLLPPSVHVVQSRTELGEAPRYWQEERYIAGAVSQRQQEFRTVRVCARRALAQLGFADFPLVPDEQRAPVWPVGVVGSMTHCEGFRAVAVASSNEVRSMGIDAEVHAPLPAEILDIVLLPEEQRMVAELTRRNPEIAWDRLIFSAKESVFKAWFPVTRRWLDFLECQISLEGQSFQFQATIQTTDATATEHALTEMSGRWIAEGPSNQGLLGTCITVL